MSAMSINCKICGEQATQGSVPNHAHLHKYSGCKCGAYYHDLQHDKSMAAYSQFDCARLCVLLRERYLKGFPAPLLWLSEDSNAVPDVAPKLLVPDLLKEWPDTVPERLDRCLCNLANFIPRPGEFGDFSKNIHQSVVFACDPIEVRYFLDALREQGLLENSTKTDQWSYVRLTVAGWARVKDLTGGINRRQNPAFVAMWFGGRESSDRQRMTDRFKNVIYKASIACGWHAERVDSREHNDSIMDRIINMIRVAPFMIADLLENNDGVYYEAGFARGRDIPVIYLVEDRLDAPKPHFDVSGVNHVRWSTEDDLRVKLENRIKGTMGLGPRIKDVGGHL